MRYGRHKVTADKNFTKGNRVRSVLRKIERKLAAVVHGDAVVGPDELATAMCENVQKGKSPARKHTTYPTYVTEFVRRISTGFNVNRPWSYYALQLTCSTRTLDEVAAILARLFYDMGDVAPAHAMLKRISDWLKENPADVGYPMGV